MPIKLYDYFRSSASYRVRIALNLKKIPYDLQTIHLVNHGGEQNQPSYRKLNPQGLVPSLETEDGAVLSQSLAIIDYLEDTHPQPALLPSAPLERAKVKSLAMVIACDLHPLNNLRVLNYLRQNFSVTEENIKDWYQHWLKLGFDAFEARLGELPRNNTVCYGETPSLADVCLIPQVYNAHRFEFPMDSYPLINSIYQHCNTLEAFERAAP